DRQWRCGSWCGVGLSPASVPEGSPRVCWRSGLPLLLVQGVEGSLPARSGLRRPLVCGRAWADDRPVRRLVCRNRRPGMGGGWSTSVLLFFELAEPIEQLVGEGFIIVGESLRSTGEHVPGARGVTTAQRCQALCLSFAGCSLELVDHQSGPSLVRGRGLQVADPGGEDRRYVVEGLGDDPTDLPVQSRGSRPDAEQ